MWSDGPGVPHPKVTPEQHRNLVPGHDRAGTRVSYATSPDGVNWSEVKDLSGPPRIDGFGWIARGFWHRDGQLLALASHFHAPGYPGKGLSLEAFRWDDSASQWIEHGTVHDDTLNNFPDATSKFFVLRTSRGYYAFVSNSNPRRRDPLTLAISHDGLVYRHLFYLVGGRHVDYPHIIERDGHLMMAFSGAKQTMEVLKVSLADVDRLIATANGPAVSAAPLSPWADEIARSCEP